MPHLRRSGRLSLRGLPRRCGPYHIERARAAARLVNVSFQEAAERGHKVGMDAVEMGVHFDRAVRNVRAQFTRHPLFGDAG
jgi:hypothetical protein